MKILLLCLLNYDDTEYRALFQVKHRRRFWGILNCIVVLGFHLPQPWIKRGLEKLFPSPWQKWYWTAEPDLCIWSLHLATFWDIEGALNRLELQVWLQIDGHGLRNTWWKKFYIHASNKASVSIISTYKKIL